MPARPLIVLVDGNAVVHRAYHAIPPLTSPGGEPTNATFGFVSTLLKVFEDQKPQYAAVAFDIGRTFRHDLYAEYKGTRPPLPDDLRVQLDRVRQVVTTLRLPAVSVDNYEADDVLATLSRRAVGKGLDVVIVTGDTDTLQLIGPHVRVLLSGRKFTDSKMYDEGAIRERYGLEPGQLVDFKTLKGDVTDNVPGVPGVGDVTATKLVQQYGGIDELYSRLDEVDPKLRGRLVENRAGVERGKTLVKLVDDLPVEVDLDKARLNTFSRDEVAKTFRELGFHTLLQRLPRTGASSSAQLPLFASAQGDEVKSAALGSYHLVDSEELLRQLVDRIRSKGACAVDVEATSVRPVEARLVGISLACEPGEAFYIPTGHTSAAARAQLDLETIRLVLGPLLADAGVAKYAHNANYDLIVLSEHGMPACGLEFDSMIAAYLLDPSGRNLGLKGLAWQELGAEMTNIEELIGSGKQQLTIDLVAVERVYPYAAADADMTLRLASRQQSQLKERSLWKLFTEIEMPLVPVLIDMECTGVALDVKVLGKMARELQQRLAELEREIQRLVGYTFNINSSQQLSDALFKKLELSTAGIQKGTSGRYSTAADVLEGLRGKHAVVDLLLEQRQLAKIKSTYVDALPLLVNPRTGRLHTSWNQTGTVTGRVSSSDPNLQNIPIRTDVGRRVREAFVAAEGARFLAADYSQVELRILAHVSGDENLLTAFRNGEDIHASTASRILGVPLSEVNSEMRRLAKAINFGLMYGMSEWGLASRTELSQDEAADFISKYFGQYPQVRQYLDRTKQQAADQGYVETVLGRKRYFPELQANSRVPGQTKAAAQRMAVNHPIQGTAADIIKIAMIRLYDELHRRNLKSKMILQVHDELVLEVPEAELEEVGPLVESVMEGAYPLDAPLKVDLKTGRHWGEME
jgi:DNA polymerase-1